ncbi:gamma-aminobutyric acid type B receptor subunit 1-like protein, partial [Dinothrombium tinctorium]
NEIEATTEPPKIELHIGGLFPMAGSGYSSGWLGGQGCLPAVKMGLEDVNSFPNLLPGYRLVLHDNDSKCDPGLGLTALYDFIYRGASKLLILGGCSIVCSTVAETAKMYNLIVVGYGASSPALSNRDRFPTFFRTHPSATIHNPTRIKLFQKFGWQRIAVILEAEEVFISTGKDLETHCKKHGIEIVTRVSFLTDPADAVKSLVRQKTRIIVGMFYGGAARRVMCEAYKQNLYGSKFVWFLIGWYEDNWYLPVQGLNCTKDEMLKAVQGHFTTEAVMLNRDSNVTQANVTAEEWLQRYHKELNLTADSPSKPEGYQEAPLAYDAIWAIALALNKTIERLAKKNIAIESFHYENSLIKDEIQEALKETKFLGVSGVVAFSNEGDRIAWTQVEQMIDGKYTKVGFYDSHHDNLVWLDKEKWLETGKPPPDRTIIVEKLNVVSTSLFITLTVISIIGIIWALGLICFNYKFRNFRYIQMSHPVSNNIMLIGCIFCLSSIVLFGLDGKKIPEYSFTLMCHARALVLSIGFSLAFGAMFTKIWFSYRLSTQIEQTSKHRRIKDVQVYLMITSFCLIDAIVLLFWYIQSPMTRRVERFDHISSDITDEDIEIEPQLEHCDANLIWYGIVYGYKGLILIFGLFLSYETRSIKLKQMNDSRLVGMSIYNVVVLCMITGPVSLVISNQTDAHFAFIAFTIIFCCFISMALIFTPKIVELVRKRNAQLAFGGSHMNGTFHDTLTSQEQEERFQRLTLESEELSSKIAEKDAQIEEIKREIEKLSKERRMKENLQKRKAVRIQEPDDDQKHLDVIHIDAVSDSGYVSNRNSRPSDFEFSESYL